jgi:hypothetical protein
MAASLPPTVGSIGCLAFAGWYYRWVLFIFASGVIKLIFLFVKMNIERYFTR